MPEPIGSAAGPQTDDRRTARMGLVGDGRAAGVRNVAAYYQALAPKQLYRPNGDFWSLARDPATGAAVVRHRRTPRQAVT
jgi:hypothetical protein